MAFKLINPGSLGNPRGFSNGVLCEPGGRLLFVAGQIGSDANQSIVSDDFTRQFDQALANVLAVVTEAGGRAEHVARMLIFVTNKLEYVEHSRTVGERYRAHM